MNDTIVCVQRDRKRKMGNLFRKELDYIFMNY